MEKEILADEDRLPSLHMIKSPEEIASDSFKTLCAAGELSIGRGSENDWILKDKQRILSVRHCRIFSEGQNCFLVDLSTNGTFLNGAQTAIGRGAMAMLTDGDHIRLGQYCFEIKFPHTLKKVEISAKKEATGDRIETDLMMQFTPTELELLGPEFAELQLDEPANPFGDGIDAKHGGHPDTQFNADFKVAPHRLGAAHQASNSDEPLGWEPMNEAWLEPSYMSGGPQEIAADWNETALANNPAPESVAQSAPPRGDGRPDARRSHPAKKERQKKGEDVPLLTDGSPGTDASLLRGLNLNSTAADAFGPADVKQKVVVLLRETLAGVQRLVRLRNKTRKALRLNVTTIRPKNNNPFQFSASLDELLKNLLLADAPGYADPIDALRATFKGLADHEAALLIGFQASQRALLKKLDPYALVPPLTEAPAGLLGRSTGRRQLLQAYRHRYQQIARDVEQSHHGLDPEFIEAYEQAIEKLAANHAK